MKRSILKLFCSTICITAFMACDPSSFILTRTRPPPPLICTGTRSSKEPLLLDFETDDRAECEIHQKPLVLSWIPVGTDSSLDCVFATAPHGRLAAYGRPWLKPPVWVKVNQCESCVQITLEHHAGATREMIEESVLRGRKSEMDFETLNAVRFEGKTKE